jgi:FemAB-related protein (PEP-CTERM system-associated)
MRVAAASNTLPVGSGPPVVHRDVTPTEWHGFVDTQREATTAHLWPWHRIFEEVFRQDCAYLAVRRNEAITGVLPLVKMRSRLFGRFVVSLPFLNNGGLLTSDDESSEALLRAAIGIAREFRASHVELRHVGRRHPELPHRQHKCGMLLSLPEQANELWDGLDRKVRNLVRKAQRSDLQAACGTTELVDDFYEVYARNMRDLGTPGYSRRLFGAVLEYFGDRARVFVVRHGGRSIAGAVALVYRGTFEVPWASSLKAYRHLAPNMLLYWTMLTSAVERGCTTFDFGRSTPEGGTFHFKQQWGAQPVPLHWEYLLLERTAIPDQGPTNPRFHAAIALWKRLPLQLTVRLGPAIVRHIP